MEQSNRDGVFIGGDVYGDVRVTQTHGGGPAGKVGRPVWGRRGMARLGVVAMVAVAVGIWWWWPRGGPVQVQGTLLQGCTAYYTHESPKQALADSTRANWGPWPGGTLLASVSRASMQPEVEVTAQTSSQESVVLTGIRVIDLVRGSVPRSGILITPGGCGAGVDPRPFTVDLDRTPATVRAEAGTLPATSFPFRIEASDPEVFQLTLNLTHGQCWFLVQVDWVDAGKPGRTVVSDAGRPFHVVGGSWPEFMPGGGPGAKDGLLPVQPN